MSKQLMHRFAFIDASNFYAPAFVCSCHRIMFWELLDFLDFLDFLCKVLILFFKCGAALRRWF